MRDLSMKALFSRISRYFGLDHPVRCRECGRPLRGAAAKEGIGPACRKKAILASAEAMMSRREVE